VHSGYPYVSGRGRGSFSAAGLVIILSGGLLLCSSTKALSQCMPAQPDPISMNAGSCTDSGGSREVTGASAAAVHVTGGSYTADAVGILNDFGSKPAVLVDGTGVVNLTNGTIITTTQSHGYGVQVDNGGTVNAANSQITTEGYGSEAILASHNGTYVTLDSVDILVRGGSARGIHVRDGAAVEGSNVSIRTTQENGNEPGSYGVWLEQGSTVTLTDSTITALGAYSSAVENYDSTFIGTRVKISATGPGDYSSGVYVSGDKGLVSLKDSRVDSKADDAHALFASDLATVSLMNTEVFSSGDGAHGLHLVDGGTIESTNVSVAATGAGASAISMARSAKVDIGSISMKGANLSSTNGPLISVIGGAGTITIDSPVALTPGIVGGRPLLASITNGPTYGADLSLALTNAPGVNGDIGVTGAGNILNATFTQSDWTGDLSGGGNTANLALNSSRWTGKSINATNISVDADSEWKITGSSDARLVTNTGLASFSHSPGGFLTLTTRDYVGSGGTLAINTVLGSDDAASDLLVIDGGAATGTTGIVAANAGGDGAQTYKDGIRIVDAINGATTSPDAFRLDRRVAAGAYEYLLFRGGMDDGEDWFLRSHLIKQPTVEVPTYRPEAALYSPVPDIARSLGLAFIGTLHERVGEQMNIRSQPDQGGRFNGAWARLIAEGGSKSWSGPLNVHAHDIRLAGIQGGLDIYRAEHNDGHRDHAGVYAAYASHRSKISGFALGEDHLGVGKQTVKGPAVGAYWTHYWPEGTYLDAVLQWNWFDVDATSDYNTQLSTSGHGFAASLEAGHPIAIAERWQIEPQVQLIYQTMSVKDSSDAFSSVAWKMDDAVTGRLGARLQYSFMDKKTLWQPYAKANLWHQFSGSDRVTLGLSPSLDSGFGQTSLEVGGGITARVSETTSLYANVDYRWSIGGNRGLSNLQGIVGIRFNW